MYSVTACYGAATAVTVFMWAPSRRLARDWANVLFYGAGSITVEYVRRVTLR